MGTPAPAQAARRETEAGNLDFVQLQPSSSQRFPLWFNTALQPHVEGPSAAMSRHEGGSWAGGQRVGAGGSRRPVLTQPLSSPLRAIIVPELSRASPALTCALGRLRGSEAALASPRLRHPAPGSVSELAAHSEALAVSRLSHVTCPLKGASVEVT